jgi:ABC-type glycerol-3-phosphate transport system substrate-binding protein
MLKRFKALVAAAVAATLFSGGAALAATVVTAPTANIMAGNIVTSNQLLNPNGNIQFQYTVQGGDLEIQGLQIQAIGSNSGTDVSNLDLTVTGLASTVGPFVPNLNVTGPIGSSFVELPDQVLSDGTVFTIFVQDGIVNAVSIQLSFATGDVAPIPLPAGGLLLGSALLMGGLAARRRKAAA